MVTQNMVRMCEGKYVFLKIKFKFATTVDVNKCLTQIKLPISLYKCAPISKLPSHISTKYIVAYSLIPTWHFCESPLSMEQNWSSGNCPL